MHFRQKFRASFVSAPQVSCKAAAFLRNCTSIINAPGGKSLHTYVCMYVPVWAGGKVGRKRRTIKFLAAYRTYQITQQTFLPFSHLHLPYFNIAHCQQRKSFTPCLAERNSGKNNHNSGIINKNNNLLPIAFSSFYNFYDFLIKLQCICLLHKAR